MVEFGKERRHILFIWSMVTREKAKLPLELAIYLLCRGLLALCRRTLGRDCHRFALWKAGAGAGRTKFERAGNVLVRAGGAGRGAGGSGLLSV